MAELTGGQRVTESGGDSMLPTGLKRPEEAKGAIDFALKLAGAKAGDRQSQKEGKGSPRDCAQHILGALSEMRHAYGDEKQKAAERMKAVKAEAGEVGLDRVQGVLEDMARDEAEKVFRIYKDTRQEVERVVGNRTRDAANDLRDPHSVGRARETIYNTGGRVNDVFSNSERSLRDGICDPERQLSMYRQALGTVLAWEAEE